MVRKGSPVRVRFRAFAKPLQIGSERHQRRSARRGDRPDRAAGRLSDGEPSRASSSYSASVYARQIARTRSSGIAPRSARAAISIPRPARFPKRPRKRSTAKPVDSRATVFSSSPCSLDPTTAGAAVCISRTTSEASLSSRRSALECRHLQWPRSRHPNWPHLMPVGGCPRPRRTLNGGPPAPSAALGSVLGA